MAICTLLAMGYQTVWMVWYDSKHLIQWPFANFVKQITVDVFSQLCCLVSRLISMTVVSYIAWIVNAIEVTVIWLVIIMVVNLIFYRDKMLKLINAVKSRKVK